MRVVQLDIGGQRLEFHPYVTVLRGVHNGLRAQLVAALGALATGEAATEGLVEAHGVFLDLSADALRLLDLGPPGVGGLDLVVAADQLPGGLGPQALVRNELDRRRERIAGELASVEAEAERARLTLGTSREAGEVNERSGSSLDRLRGDLEGLVETRQVLETNLEVASSVHTHAQQALEVEQQRLARARQHRAQAARVAGEAAHTLEAARTRGDPFAAAAFDAARERLRLLQAPGEDEPDAGEDAVTGAAITDPAAEANRLELRSAELEAALLALDTIDPYPVESALEQVKSNDDVELVPSTDASRVASEWVRNEAALAGDQSVEETSGSVLAVARRRLDAARAAVFEAERAVRAPEIDRLDIEALENAHEAVLVAQDKADKRFGGDRGRQKLLEARAMERAILDRIGFDTYASFMMGTSIQHVDTEREERLEITRAELASAEDALTVLEQGIDAELALAALLARRRDLRDEAARILGRDPGDDIEWALRHHRIEVRGGGERTQRLRAALQSAGMVLGSEQLPQRMLIDLAEIWLDEQRETAEQRDRLGHELGEVEASFSRLRKAARRPRPEDEAADADPDVHELEQARAAMAEAEQRLQHQSEVEAEVSHRKSNLAQALEVERAAAAQLLTAEQAEAEAARAEHESAGEQARLQAELAAAVGAERQAQDALNDLTRLIRGIGPDDRSARAAVVGEAEVAVAHAEAAVAAARAELAEVDELLERLTSEGDDESVVTSATAVEELEWYLLSRLAEQRSLSYAGSLPFVLDDALRGVRGDGLHHLLSRLERMSSAVQVVILSDDNEIAAWADAIGADRAVTLYPVPL
jgi:hypothetical protein